MRRITLIIIVLVIMLAAGGGAVYYFYFSKSSDDSSASKTPKAANSTPTPPKPTPAKGVPVTITPRKVVSPTFATDQQAVWYFSSEGELYRFSFAEGAEKPFGLIGFTPIQKAFWPKAGNDFIIRTAQEGAASLRLYQALSKQFLDLPGAIWDLAWHPDGQRIVYVWRRADGKFELKISRSDGTNFFKIADLDASYKVAVSPKGDSVLLYGSQTASPVRKVLQVNLKDGQPGTISELLDRGNNIDVLFSPDGNKLLFTRVNEQTSLPEIWLHDFAEKTFKKLGIVTSISKTAWNSSGSKLYLGVPGSIASGDAEVSSATTDNIISYSIGNGQKTQIWASDVATRVDFRDLAVSNDESVVIFRNGQDGKLYRIDLK